MKHIKRNSYYLLLVISLAALCHTGHAELAVEVALTGGARTESFTNIEDAIDSLLDDPSTTYGGSFGILDNFTGTLSIFGFDINLNFSGGDVNLTFLGADGTSIVTVPFAGNGSRADALSLLDDFLHSDGAEGAYRSLMESLQVHARFNFISGSESTVGQSVRDNTMRAMGRSQTAAERRISARGASTFSIGAEYNDFEVNGYSGTSYTVPIEFGTGIGKWGSLMFRLPLGFTDIEGTELYRLGMELDLGITLTGHSPKAPFRWQVTPTVGNYILGTTDLYVGGDIYNYGLQNQFEARMGQFSASYGIYYGKYKSTELSISDLVVDLGVDTTIISNGIKVIWNLGPHALLDIYAINSRPEEGVGYHEVNTIGGGLRIHAGSTALRIGYAEDEGGDTENDAFEAKRIIATFIVSF